MKRRRIKGADLFCGGGGTSTALIKACAEIDRPLDLVAVNHWQRAVETHAANHPKAIHACEDLTTMDPRKVVPGGRLDILVASPECTHHSIARGGVPMSDQSRASVWCILRWASALRIDRILIENVKEFQSYGPLGANGRPLKSRRGETFEAFINSLRSLGYKLEWRILNAADYGDATTRERLFIQAVKGRRPIRWPAPSHAKDQRPALFDHRKPWRAAREIIDWRLRGKSIFGRKRPLVENTLKRIEAGLKKFGGANAEPFLLILRGKDRYVRSITEPVPTITSSGGHVGLCEPFLMTCTHQGGDRVNSVDAPVPTITTAKRGEHALIEPFIFVNNYPNSREHDERYSASIDDPLPTVTSQGNRFGICEPFIVPQFSENGPRSIDAPLGGITTTSRGMGLCEPFVVPFYSNGEADSIADPLRTITARDRFGLCQTAYLDILFRMLQPHELAAAMSFPGDYRFCGNREEVVKQIGNAVPIWLAKALCQTMLEDAA